jgi:hypothetical protein
MNAKEVDLAQIVALCFTPIGVMSVGTACGPMDCAASQSASLALDSCETHAIVDNKVIACVLPERNRDSESDRAQRDHHGQCGSVADVLWMIHEARLPAGSAGPCPEQTTGASPTIRSAPE